MKIPPPYFCLPVYNLSLKLLVTIIRWFLLPREIFYISEKFKNENVLLVKIIYSGFFTAKRNLLL